ncbi:MAG: hypothetical protein Q9163_002987 [Psora crenata]
MQAPLTCQHPQLSRHHSPLSPTKEPFVTRSPRELFYRTSSLDRWHRRYHLDRRRNVSSSASGDRLIPDTEPEEIEELWRYIRKELKRRMAPPRSNIPIRPAVDRTLRSRGNEQGSKSEAQGDASTEAVSLRYPTETGDPSTVMTTVSSPRNRKASPYEKDFREQILTPRGILIVQKRSISVWDHFQTKEPDQDRISFYRKHCSEHSAVWLNADYAFLEEVAKEYRCMVEGNMCEAEFASYAKETLFRRDPRVSVWEFSNLRAWKTDRMLELFAKPEQEGFIPWHSPPLLDKSQGFKTYDFDIRPDCAYWLSLQAFNSEYVSEVQQWAFVAKRRITCPYLFIEFKRDEKDPSSAENQVAVAASIALYNRFNLRLARMEEAGTPLERLDVHNVRVYGITFQAASFVVWCIQPQRGANTGFEWAGCTMTRIGHGDCDNTAEVKKLVDWINEIHRWGLTVHGPGCERDIKICVAKRFGSRVSDVDAGLQ